MGNKRNKKRETKLIWIFCEGKSEKNYIKQFIAFEQIKRTNVKDSIYTNPIGIINEAILHKRKREYTKDEFICVFDTENIDSKSNKEINILAKQNKIKIIRSYPCFEYWILCHFEKCNYVSSKEIICRVKKVFPSYKKGHPDLYNFLRNKIDLSMKNAKENLKKSKKKKQKIYAYTEIPSLIKYLRSL